MRRRRKRWFRKSLQARSIRSPTSRTWRTISCATLRLCSCYKTDGDLKKLKRDNAYLNRLIDANIEGYRAIRNAGHEILPDADKEFEDAAYRKTCFRFFKLMCATALGKICASDHAMNAVDEMSALNRDMKAFFDVTGAKYPVWKTLEAECGSYLREKSDRLVRATLPAGFVA